MTPPIPPRGPILALLLAVAGAGCGHVPVASMIKLARIDFASTDPAQLRAAVKLPRSIQPQGVSLRVGVKLSNGEEEFQEFSLRQESDLQDVLMLAREADADTHVFVYRLEAGEAARLSAFREMLRKKQAASGGRGGALTISLRPQACRTGEPSSRPIYLTTYLRTIETGDYVPLTRDVDLRTIDPKQDVVAQMAPCA